MMTATTGDDNDEEPESVSPVPSISSDVPGSNDEAMPLTPVRTKSDAEEEPAWLSDAITRVSDFHIGYPLDMQVADEELSKSPRAASHTAAVIDKNATHAILPSIPSPPASVAFARAVNASSAALAEVRSLSIQELSDGLLGLSVSCTRSMRSSTQAGLAATARFAREMYTAAVVTAPPPGETRLQTSLAVVQGHWRELMQLPTAGVFAACALMNAVLAMLLTFMRYTPLAAREFASYVQAQTREYHAEYTNVRLREARRAPADRPQQVLEEEHNQVAGYAV